MSRELAESFGSNEALFREINEAIERGQWPGDEPARVSFRCECARLGCTQIVGLTVEEYEAVRARPRRFFVHPGHEEPRVEDVVARHDRYVVVQKRGQAAVRADETDPRPRD